MSTTTKPADRPEQATASPQPACPICGASVSRQSIRHTEVCTPCHQAGLVHDAMTRLDTTTPDGRPFRQAVEDYVADYRARSGRNPWTR